MPAVTTPVEPTEAREVLLIDQLPPGVASERFVELPTSTVAVPLIGCIGLIVTSYVTYAPPTV